MEFNIMSIASAINDLKGRVNNAYDALEVKGATIPEVKNTSNLVAAINTIKGAIGQDTGEMIVTGHDRDGRTILPSIIKPTLLNNFDKLIYYFTVVNSKFFICYDDNSGIFYSNDGNSWIQSSITTGKFTRIVYGNGKYAAVPQDEVGYLYISEDGSAWTKSEKICDYQINDIVYYSSRFIISYYSYLNYSTDLNTWTDCTYYPYKGQNRPYGRFSVLNNNNYVFVNSASGTGTSSNNGLNWNGIAYNGAGFDDKVCFLNNLFIKSLSTILLSCSSRDFYWNGTTRYLTNLDDLEFCGPVVRNGICFGYSNGRRRFIYTKDAITWTEDNFGFLKKGKNFLEVSDNICYFLHSDGEVNSLYSLDSNEPYNCITELNLKTLPADSIIIKPSNIRYSYSTDKTQYIGYDNITVRGIPRRTATVNPDIKEQKILPYPYIACLGSGLWYSYDGVTWTISNQTRYSFIEFANGGDKGLVAVRSSSYPIYYSSNLTSWTQASSSNLSSAIGADVVYSNEKDIFVLAATTGIHYDGSSSGSWAKSNCTDPCTKLFEHKGTFLAATTSGIWYSENGSEWVQSNKIDGTFKCFYWYNNLLLAGGDQGIWYSQDKGKTWNQTDATSGTFNTIIHTTQYIAGGNQGIWSSSDGLTWTQSALQNITCNALSSRITICVATNQGIFYSTDRGVTWEQSDKTDGNFSFLYNDSTKFIAGGDQGIWYASSASGENWLPSNITDKVCRGLFIDTGTSFDYSTVTFNPVTSEIDSDIQAENIKEGVEILGVTGTLPVLNNEEKVVFPLTTIQEVIPSTGFTGLSKVTIDKIHSGTITTDAETTSKTIIASENVEANTLFIGTNAGIWYSLDNGITWIQTEKNTGTFYGILYNNGMFIGCDTGIWYSNDGVNWEETNKNTSTWYSVVFGNNVYVACGNRTIGLWYSSDGITWIASNKNNVITYDCTYGNGKFIAGCGSTGLWYSTDGSTWAQSNKTDLAFYSVNYCNGRFFAGSSSAGIWYSDDGITWTQSNKTNLGFRSIFYANGIYLAGGSAATTGIWYSTDGINWSQTNKTDLIWRKFAYSDGKYIGCTTTAGVWYSDDGISWSQSSLTSQAVYSITKKPVDSYLSSVTINPVTSTIDSNIQPQNIVSGITILGVSGTATSGGGITPTGNINITNTTQTDVTNYATAQVVDSNLVSGNIKKDVQILGVTGTYEATSTSHRNVYIHAVDADSASMQIGANSSTSISIQEFLLDLSSSEYDNKNIVFSSTNDSKTAYIIYEDGITSTQSLPVTIPISKSFSIYLNCYNYCLDKDTRILLPDYSEKKISELSISDRVMTFNPDTLEIEADELTYCDSHILKCHDEKDIWFFDDGTEITTVRPHEFYNIDKHQFMYISDFKIGDRVYKVNGTTPKLIGHKNIKEKTEHYTIFTKKYNNYFANGILTGNRNSSKIKINLK